MPQEQLPTLLSLKKKLIKALEEAEKDQDDWFNVIQFPEDQIPEVQELLEHLVMINSPINDENDWAKNLEVIQKDIENLSDYPLLIELKSPEEIPERNSDEEEQ